MGGVGDAERIPYGQLCTKVLFTLGPEAGRAVEFPLRVPPLTQGDPDINDRNYSAGASSHVYMSNLELHLHAICPEARRQVSNQCRRELSAFTNLTLEADLSS